MGSGRRWLPESLCLKEDTKGPGVVTDTGS